MRIVGTQDRSEIERDPLRAWQRGQQLDALLRAALAPHPHGVWRLTHAERNRLDFERQIAQAAKLNSR